MRLSDLVQPLVLKQIKGDADVWITGIETDSRKIQKGQLFIALRGFTVDGHAFVEQAIQQGAAAVMVEENMNVAVPVVLVPDTRRAMAIVASTFYHHPTRELKLIGVTGTNGKTTTSHLIRHMLLQNGKETGLIGTVGMKIKNREYSVSNTTPDVVELQKSFRYMCEQGCEYAVMEVSSHALDMGRVRGCAFHLAVFTNLTQDHLDYHQTMDRYREAKGLLFSQLGNQYQHSDPQIAILNADDPVSAYYAHITSQQVITYGIEKPADIRATQVKTTASGTSFYLETFAGNLEISLQLVGKFNVYNALAAIAVGLVEGISLNAIKHSLEEVRSFAGRFERIDVGQDFTVLVDYAHTPDSLHNVLTTIKEFAQGNIICVVGCGGDRDRAKRPIMAQIAYQYSDIAIFTSDNPRSEEPEAIIKEMLNGLTEDEQKQVVTIVDRKEAIRYAIQKANAQDVILIAGKGHETYQEIQGVRYDFDDRQVAKEALLEVQR